MLRQPPRDRSESIIPRPKLAKMMRESAVITAGSLLSLVIGRARYGDGGRPKTMAFNSLILAQLAHAFACRTDGPAFRNGGFLRGNRALTTAIGTSIALQAVAMAVPPVRRFLGAVPLGFTDIVVSTAGAVLPLYVNDLFESSGKQPEPAAAGSTYE